jgi:hypothetical protein
MTTAPLHSTSKVRQAASAAVLREWGRRVHAEYRSAAFTQHLTLWLIQLGASPDLLDAGLRIVADELAHAELSHGVHVDAGGGPLGPVARESLALPVVPGEPLEAAVTRAGVEIFCLGETVAVPLFKELRAACAVDSARAAFDRILRDEVRHREFGWSLLAYLLDLPCQQEVHALVVRELPAMFARLRRSYASGREDATSGLSDDDAAWGLMPAARYAEVLEATLERDYVPRFGTHGIDARSAWQTATGSRSAP